ncbi:NB-ARC domain-containing protein [Saccharopolyspora indica]
MDQLIEELWEDRPPASATTTLQTYVYQLRKMLGLAEPAAGAQEVVLTTRSGGYSLRIPEKSVDVHCFEELAEQGRREVDSGAVESGAELLRSALRLWRGPAFNDVAAGPVLHADLVRLEETRRSIVEQRLEAELFLGQHHQLIGELSGLSAQMPTHEGFHAKLMIALYRAGRRSEALQAYRRLRDALADELGLEPSPDLQKLHRQLLASDSELATPAGSQRNTRLSALVEAPVQLPAEVPRLFGRTAEVEKVSYLLREPVGAVSPVVSVVGAPGSGKSAFSVKVAHQLRSAFPDGPLYASLAGLPDDPAAVGDVLANFLRAAGIRAEQLPPGVAERSQLFRSWSAQSKLLVVLDDVVSASQVAPLLPSGRGSAALISARRRLSGSTVGSGVELGPLGHENSLSLLASVLGAQRVEQDLDGASRLARLCGGLPMALQAAAGRLVLRPHWSLTRLAKRLRSSHHVLDELNDGQHDMRRSIEVSWRLLSSAHRAAFVRIGAHVKGNVSVRCTAEVLGVDENEAESLLENLVELRLVDAEPSVADDFVYNFPPLVRLAARALAEAEPPAVPQTVAELPFTARGTARYVAGAPA